ncbi:killer cell lectin-like receptor subfamily F member 1, partial [Biomphalaria glabrata]
MSSHIYTIKTLEKLKILQDNYSNISNIWIGLNDIAVEGDYRWEDDDSVCDVSWQPMIYIL